MSIKSDRYSSKWLCGILSIGVLIISTGCGSVKHQLDVQNNYALRPDSKIELGPIGNQTGKTFEYNIEQLLADALAEAINNEGLAWAGAGKKLVMTTKIAEYEPGNAFKRWLLPGWGSTVLTVQCDLKDGDQLVATEQARRTVSVGGGYTIGAWRTIFGSIAKDIVGDIRKKIDGQQ